MAGDAGFRAVSESLEIDSISRLGHRRRWPDLSCECYLKSPENEPPPKSFFAQAIGLHEDAPEKVATDGLASYPRAIEEEELGQDTEHEVRPCTANPVEQSHRRIKHRYYPTLGFGEFETAQRLCRAVDEVGNFLRPRSRMAEFVCLADLRQKFMQGVGELAASFKAA
ncbi:MAG: DDE-type integrase/transposase/recombinase [Phormidesmis sp.]